MVKININEIKGNIHCKIACPSVHIGIQVSFLFTNTSILAVILSRWDKFKNNLNHWQYLGTRKKTRWGYLSPSIHYAIIFKLCLHASTYALDTINRFSKTIQRLASVCTCLCVYASVRACVKLWCVFLCVSVVTPCFSLSCLFCFVLGFFIIFAIHLQCYITFKVQKKDSQIDFTFIFVPSCRKTWQTDKVFHGDLPPYQFSFNKIVSISSLHDEEYLKEVWPLWLLKLFYLNIYEGCPRSM